MPEDDSSEPEDIPISNDSAVSDEAESTEVTPPDTAESTPTTETEVTASTTVTTTTASTTQTTSAPEEKEEKPEEIKPVFSEFRYEKKALKRAEEFGIDAERREQVNAKFMEETKLPIIHVSTENGKQILSREEYVTCLVDVFNCEDEHMMYSREGGIKVRGNSTAYYGEENKVLHNQVPYRIKFDKKTSMLGLNDNAECKSWVLLKATWNILPDFIAFKLADMLMGDEYYSSDCTFTYVYVNERFMGLYLLCEQNQINKHRVDINEVEKDYTGTDIGYFLELDNYADENTYYFTMDYCGETLTDLEGTTRALVPAEYTIKNDIYSQEQVDFISQYLADVYKIMIQAIKYDTYLTFDENYDLIPADDSFDNAYDTINAVVDLESVLNMYILYEITHDYDCGEGSFFMAVDFSKQSKMKRLTFTAPWDFNWAYSDSPIRKYYAGAFNADSFVNQYGDRTNPWFVLLMGTDWFTEMVQQRWRKLYSEGGFAGVQDYCNEYLEYYYDDLQVEPHYYSSNAQELLKWVKNRIKWLNMEWGEPS